MMQATPAIRRRFAQSVVIVLMVNIPRLRKRVEPNEKTVLETPLPRVAFDAPGRPQKSLCLSFF
jgi:hypothetical protein